MPSERPDAAADRGDTLAAVAAAIEERSPGFAQRLRALAPAIEGELPAATARAHAAAMRRLIAIEGPGREATVALAGLGIADLAAVGPDGLAAWCAAAETVAAHSVRAASSFATGSLTSLVAGAPAARLVAAADAVAGLAARHGGDPAVLRFATAAGAEIGRHGGPVVAAWAAFCALTAFGARRASDAGTRLPVAAGLADEHFAASIDLARVLAAVDRERALRLFQHLPAELARVPRASRAPLLELLALLGNDADAVADCAEVFGPVLRRLPAPARGLVLELAREVATELPRASSRFLRSVLRVGDAVGFGENLRAFVEKGLGLAAQQPGAAALAFFALESRGARAFLRRHDVAVLLEDVEATLRGYLHLITGARPTLAPSDATGLFPPISLEPAVVPVAARIDVFPTWEENFTLLKLQVTLGTLWGELGTRDFRLEDWLGGDAAEQSGAQVAGLAELFRRFENPDAAAGLFAHLEAVRAMPLVARRLPGLAADLAPLRLRLFPAGRPAPGHDAPEAVLFLALGGSADDLDLGGAWGEALAQLARGAARGTATVVDTARVTELLCARLAEGDLLPVYGIESFLEEDIMLSYLLEEDDEPRPGAPAQSEGARERIEDVRDAAGQRSDETSPGESVDPDLLRAYLEQRPDLTVMRAEGPIDATGLFVAGLTGGGAQEKRDSRSGSLAADQALALARHGHRARGVFLHDEWDYSIADYRHQWCTVREVALDGDEGEFFAGTLARYVEMLPEVRRQFQRVKPEGYRILHGLLDGEDFDLNAVVMARADLRARRTPSPKLYTARQREERDVATLFLLDMSASTDEEAEPAPPLPEDAPDDAVLDLRRAGRAGPRPRRIIDIQKEALVIMAQALDEIGDLYSIYGFSGHGRDCVEFFDVKSFDEPLSQAVRARIGAIEPQRSTRMGAAIRQATAKLRAVASRAKHLILLSDGFPQDFDYGEDRRSNVYGLRDTTMALREAMKAGIQPFCITVDRAGHDYLREMCDASRYLVIEDIGALPRELPKIYSEATRGV